MAKSNSQHRADYDPPGVRGPLVWCVTKGEVMEIRMTDNLLDDCFRAAETLGARFFVMRYERPKYLGLPADRCWAVYDCKNRDPQGTGLVATALQGGGSARPVKLFDTDTTDAPVMWAMMRGSNK